MSTLLEITGSGVGIISLRNIRVENPHFFPHGSALADELLMSRRRLIGIVRRVILKDDDQGDFKIAIVHLAAIVGTRAGGKENFARDARSNTSGTPRPFSADSRAWAHAA